MTSRGPGTTAVDDTAHDEALTAFVAARTRLTPNAEYVHTLDRMLMEVARKLLVRAHKLALHGGSEVVNARDLEAAVRFELRSELGEVVCANLGAAVARVVEDPTVDPARTELHPR